MFVNNVHRFISHGVQDFPASDHSIVFVVKKAGVCKGHGIIKEARSFKQYNKEQFCQHINGCVDWYTANRLSLNVKKTKTKMMLAGSRTMLSTFQNFEFKLDGEPVSRVPEFKYLGTMLDERSGTGSHTLAIYHKSLAIGCQYLIAFYIFWTKTHV